MPDGRIQQTHAAAQRPERRPDLILPLTIAKPMRAVGCFSALALDTMVQIPQTWFIACAGNVSGRKSRRRPSFFGRALRSHSALVDRVDRRHRPTSPVSNRLEV